MKKLEAGLKSTAILAVRVRPDRAFVDPGWRKLGPDELKRCLWAKLTVSVRGVKSEIAIEPPGDSIGIAMASGILSAVPHGRAASIDKIITSGTLPILSSLVKKATDMYGAEVERFSRDRVKMERIGEVFRKARKERVSAEVIKVLREATECMTFEEVKEIWDVAQVESVLES